MSSNQRMITPSTVVTHMETGNLGGVRTISYGRHPDSNEVIVVVQHGAISEREGFSPMPEDQWRTLDFDDGSLVDALFMETELQDIRRLIERKNELSINARLQYFHKIIGEALSG